jgi:uncharacterized membrane protein YhhN
VVFYLIAEVKQLRRGRVLGKMLAATCFVVLALLMGASRSTYGQIMMAAFLFSWLGDLFLLSKEQKWFLAGLVSFLLAHLAFALAFYQRGIATGSLLFPTIFVGFLALLIGYWLLPKVEKDMKVPVVVYMVAIVGMVVSAFGTHHHLNDLTIPIAACVFMASDLFVARDQFVKESFLNKLIGAPLYFGAQMAFATSVT